VLAVVVLNNVFAATNGVHEREGTQLILLFLTKLDLTLELSYPSLFLPPEPKKMGAV
jgi:hypothetical protein